jgi:hypothetical protein
LHHSTVHTRYERKIPRNGSKSVSNYSLRRELDDGPPVHFIFYKTPPRVSVLLRLAPWHQKIKSRPFQSSSPAVVGSRRHPSTPSVAPPPPDPSQRAGALCLLGSLGQRGGEIPPDSACPLPPPPLVNPARSSTLARGTRPRRRPRSRSTKTAHPCPPPRRRPCPPRGRRAAASHPAGFTSSC